MKIKNEFKRLSYLMMEPVEFLKSIKVVEPNSEEAKKSTIELLNSGKVHPDFLKDYFLARFIHYGDVNNGSKLTVHRISELVDGVDSGDENLINNVRIIFPSMREILETAVTIADSIKYDEDDNEVVEDILEDTITKLVSAIQKVHGEKDEKWIEATTDACLLVCTEEDEDDEEETEE